MIDKGIKLLVIPPGGWKFEQVIEGANPFLVEGQTYAQLEEKVFSFRLANVDLIPSGTATRESVRDDIRAYICSRFPTQCTGDWSVKEHSPVQITETGERGYLLPIQRIGDWFKKLAFNELTWKEASTANDRAAICAKCPQNIRWQTNCAPCVGSVTTRIARFKGDRSTPLDAQLQACRCFGHHNELAIWMDNTLSTAQETPPDFCWNK